MKNLNSSSWLCGKLFLFAVAAFLPAIAAAEISKEDPAVTGLMREKLATLFNAYSNNDAKAYAAALQPLLQDAVRQSPADLVKRYTSLEVIAKNRLDGLQPLIFRYAKSIFLVASSIDAQIIANLRSSLPLAQSTANSGVAANCGAVVREALHGRFPEVNDLAGLACLTTDPEVHPLTLSVSGITLPDHDACESLPNYLVYRLDVPSTIPGASISSMEVLNLPFPQILDWWQDWANRRWVSVYSRPFSDPLPAWAQSESFTVRITTSTGTINFPVTFGIKAAIHDLSCRSNAPVRVGIGDVLNWSAYGNGPRGPRVWSVSSVRGSPGFPAGLTFTQGTGPLAGHGVVSGTVQPGAVNGAVDLRYVQGTDMITQVYGFEVALRADPVRVAQLSAVQPIARGQVVSIRLPDALGADGTYVWAGGGNLPAGLSLVHNSNGWFVTGTVDRNAVLDLRYVRLTLSSAGQSFVLTLTFDSRRPLSVYTQNMILFPPEIVNPLVDCLPVVAWPPTYGTCVALLEGANAIYHAAGIHNSDSDNHERAGFVIDHINAERYDIVALQEVWDGPLTHAELARIVNDTSANYRAVRGPGTTFSLAPPVFKINSGLLTLVKWPAPTAAPASPMDQTATFRDVGDGADRLSNKGFVVTQAFLTDDPTEFVWVINTHLHATESNTRRLQLHQLATFLGTLPTTNPVLLMGDLNIESDENYRSSLNTGSEYSHMRTILTGFEDIALARALMTDSWDTNAYNHQWSGQKPEKRIDYILIRQGSLFALDWNSDEVVLVNSKPNVRYTSLCVNWALPTAITCHYSDHFGLRTTLKLRHR